MNIVELLDRSIQSFPETPAIIEGASGSESMSTFAELGDHSRRLATLFLRAGLKAGDGIVLMVPMSAVLYAAIAAAWRLGLVSVFIDPAAGKNHITQSLARYPVRAFVGSPSACLLRLFVPALRNISSAFVAGRYFPGAKSLSSSRRLSRYEEVHSCAPDTPAMLAFTSGSTGQPKGVVRTHGLLMSTHSVMTRHVRAYSGEVVLATMPLLTLINMGCGVTSLIPDADLRNPGAIDPRRLYQQIMRWHVARVGASPALLERLADACLIHGHYLESVREFYVGGAPVFPRVMDKLLKVAPRSKVLVLYGCTEAEPIAMVSSDDVRQEDQEQTFSGQGILVGRPIPEIKLRILRDRWGEPRGTMTFQALEQDTLESGKTGEIVVSGSNVAPGYLNGAGDAETKFRVGDVIWHRTGDAGWLDERERLWLLGRCAARIADQADVLYPYSIEAALSEYPDVVRSAFLSHLGQRLLVLELRSRGYFDIDAIVRRFAWAKINSVVILTSVPVDRRHNAKVDYPALRSILDAGVWLDRVACDPSAYAP